MNVGNGKLGKVTAMDSYPSPEENLLTRHIELVGLFISGLSQKDNMDDMTRKGRASKVGIFGEDNGSAILTQIEVGQIRQQYATGNFAQSELGSMYNVSKDAIGLIIRNENWIDSDYIVPVGVLKIRTGNPPKFSGQDHPQSKLTWYDVRTIRKRYQKGGISQRKLARKYGVTHIAIGFIIRNKTWKE